MTLHIMTNEEKIEIEGDRWARDDGRNLWVYRDDDPILEVDSDQFVYIRRS